jgi:hypothetical protein
VGEAVVGTAVIWERLLSGKGCFLGKAVVWEVVYVGGESSGRTASGQRM